MAIATGSMTVVAAVQPLNAVATSTHAHLASAPRLGGIRLNNAALAGGGLRAPGRSAKGVVRAEKDVTDKVQNIADGTSREVQKAAGGLKGIFQGFADFFSGKKSEAKDVGRDAQNRAQRLGDQAADATRDMEGSARNAASDARSEAQNLGSKAQNALGDAGDSLKRSFDDASSSAQNAGKDLQKQTESAADAAQDTARDVKGDVQKGVDRMKS